jgi:hypothetical protein
MSLRNLLRFRISVFSAIIAILVMGAIIFTISYMIYHGKTDKVAPNNDPTSSVTIASTGIKYPEGWSEATQISVRENQAGVLAAVSKQNSNARMVLRQIKGDLPKDFDITTLPGKIVEDLQKNIEGFSLNEKRTLKIDKYEAVKINYNQVSSADQSIQHYSMYIVPTSSTTYYITYNGGGQEISSLDKDINSINQSVGAYIQSH